MFPYPLTAAVTLAALLLYIILTWNVGSARARFKLLPPAIMGDAAFERRLRVQQNTLEQLMFFLPSLWLFTIFLQPYSGHMVGAILGIIWLLARAYYAYSYYTDAKKRLPGFMIALIISAILWLGAVIGVVMFYINTNALNTNLENINAERTTE